MDKFKMALAKSMAANKDEKASANPSSTKGMTYAMNKRREELEAKRKNEELKKKEDADRLTKQNRVVSLLLTIID